MYQALEKINIVVGYRKFWAYFILKQGLPFKAVQTQLRLSCRTADQTVPSTKVGFGPAQSQSRRGKITCISFGSAAHDAESRLCKFRVRPRPKTQQKVVMQMLDGVLAQASR